MSEVLCVASHPQDDPGIPLDGLLLCGRHRHRIDTDTSEIAALIVDSRQIIEGGITGAPLDDGPRGKTPKKRADPPAPGDVQLMTLFDPRTAAARIPSSPANPLGDQSEPQPNVLAVIASWVLLVREERPLTETRSRVIIRRNRALALDWYTAPMTLPMSVLAQLDLLRRHHEWMAAQPFVDDYVAEMGDVRKALAAAVRDVRFERRGHCQLPAHDREGACGGTLLEENGTRAVACTRCRARWVTAQELARLAISQEQTA